MVADTRIGRRLRISPNEPVAPGVKSPDSLFSVNVSRPACGSPDSVSQPREKSTPVPRRT